MSRKAFVRSTVEFLVTAESINCNLKKKIKEGGAQTSVKTSRTFQSKGCLLAPSFENANKEMERQRK